MSSVSSQPIARSPLIEKMLFAKLNALLTVECEGGVALSVVKGFGEADESLPYAWVFDRIYGVNPPRRYSLVAFAQEWASEHYNEDDSHNTVEALMERLAPWYYTYKVVIAEVEAYCLETDETCGMEWLTDLIEEQDKEKKRMKAVRAKIEAYEAEVKAAKQAEKVARCAKYEAEVKVAEKAAAPVEVESSLQYLLQALRYEATYTSTSGDEAE